MILERQKGFQLEGCYKEKKNRMAARKNTMNTREIQGEVCLPWLSRLK